MVKEKKEPGMPPVTSDVAVALAEPIDVNVFLPDGSVVEFNSGKATVSPDVADKLKKHGVI